MPKVDVKIEWLTVNEYKGLLVFDHVQILQVYILTNIYQILKVMLYVYDQYYSRK